MRVKSKIDLWISIVIWSVTFVMVGTMTRLGDQTAISYGIGLQNRWPIIEKCILSAIDV